MKWDKTISILGTEWDIVSLPYNKNDYMTANLFFGFCDGTNKQILIIDLSTTCDSLTVEEQMIEESKTLRHEIIHAFLKESGFETCAAKYDGPWSQNEEMIDWFAIQSPKIFYVYREVGCLDCLHIKRNVGIEGGVGNG